MIKVQMTDMNELKDLMSPEDYAEFIKQQNEEEDEDEGD